MRKTTSRNAIRAALRLIGVALLVAVLPANAAVNIFMKIGGAPANMNNTQSAPALPGESVDVQYPSWVPLLSVSNGIVLPTSLSGPLGPSQHSDVTITKQVDRTTPTVNLLANGSASGTSLTLPIDYVTIDFRMSGSIVFYRLAMEGVYVTSATSSSVGDVVTETITFKYQRIRWSYVPYASGKAGQVITKGWDLNKNVAY